MLTNSSVKLGDFQKLQSKLRGINVRGTEEEKEEKQREEESMKWMFVGVSESPEQGRLNTNWGRENIF
ncbi:unnamed protein product [Ilex paraguariensis]|uniref:Uncharacterized protein n=1 Tax=Ilex paraguariensis TaxID=185542 RepID=A0ABC8RFU1_9AQUA